MRIQQMRTYRIYFSKEDQLAFTPLRGGPPGFVTEMNIGVTPTGKAAIRFVGYYHDPFDMELTLIEEPDVYEPRPKRKNFQTEVFIDQMDLPADDPVKQFVAKFNLVRVDDLSMATFMAEEDPVG